MNIDYNKLKRLFKDWQSIDTFINVDVDFISKYDQEMVRSGYSQIDASNGKMSNHFTQDQHKLFMTTKVIGMGHIRYLLNVIKVLLQDDYEKKQIELLNKECQALKEVIDACQKERALLKKQLDGKKI